jgi:hypothetical protein
MASSLYSPQTKAGDGVVLVMGSRSYVVTAIRDDVSM